jgi:hypothetical protein
MSADTTPDQRTPALPGKASWQQWPADLTVEYGPIVSGEPQGGTGFVSKTYPVFLDGEEVGTIVRVREPNYRPVKGLGVRQVTSYGTKWKIRARRGPVSRPGVELRWSSRSEATARLVTFHLTGTTDRPL